MRLVTNAMEDFLANPKPPAEIALEQLRNSDVMLLVIGFKAGTLLADGSGSTYTSAEFDELLRIGKEPLVFIKQAKHEGEPHASWRNEESDPDKREALDAFKARVTSEYTPDYFTTPEGLALDVVLALHQWEERGRPGARRTFASASDYFASKNPVGHFQILDFGTTLLGRDEQIGALNEFAADAGQRVCILSGRGGIGKSKILHDWSKANPATVVFLKDEPQWHEDSEKEIPFACKTIVVDDAHRQDGLGKVLQVLQETASHRNLKLILSTRPGSATRLAQQLFQKIDTSQVTQLPELQELDREQSRALAVQVLGNEFREFAAHLAEIGSNSPLVIVAGGRLIASRRINPSTLTTLKEFRSTVFNRLLEEMDIQGQRFAINPPRPVLDLISALGPVDVETREFRQSAEALLGRPIDEILSTVDALAATGFVTPRPRPVRIIPDVLSDYILEGCCVGPNGRTTQYADRVYQHFGAHSLRELMRNLAELDWRRGQAGESGLNLLNEIWIDIHQRFRQGDEYARHSILSDLAGAAIYQPDQVIRLVRTAIDNPIQVDSSEQLSSYRSGQEYVLSALPGLLEATAYHADRLTESVTTLWELAKGRGERGSADSARSALKRLASWHRYGHPALNFAMLIQAIRLTRREDAFTSDFTPFTLIQQILQRDGEFSEWRDDTTYSFGGFGLNYRAVGPVRENALDFLEFALAGDGAAALCAIPIMEDLLHNYLTRMGREITTEEDEWQNRERARCLAGLARRYAQPASALLKARIYDALRSATAINCREPIRQAAAAALAEIAVEDDVAVLDALCTAEHDLPILSAEFDEDGWERPITEIMKRGKSCLERLIAGPGNQAHFTIDQTCACLDLRIKTSGFHRFMLAFSDRPDYLFEMAEQLAAHPRTVELINHLSSVLSSIHFADPSAFRRRALFALQSGAVHVVRAMASNLRVFEGATEQDIAVIQAYGGYPDPVVKRGAIFAITYMGKFVELREERKQAVLSIHTQGDKSVAADLADAFGPYGVPLTMLTKEEAAAVASEFLDVRDWEHDQGAIPRFLTRFASLFPDEVYDLLIRRIELSAQAGPSGRWSFRIFGLVHANISFGGVTADKRLKLAQDCIGRLLRADSGEEFAELYWDVAGYDEAALELVVNSAHGAGDNAVHNIGALIQKAIPKLAFTSTEFAKGLLKQFTGTARETLVEALAHQARRFGGGVYAGGAEEHMAQQDRAFADQVAAFPDDPDTADLARALRRLT